MFYHYKCHKNELNSNIMGKTNWLVLLHSHSHSDSHSQLKYMLSIGVLKTNYFKPQKQVTTNSIAFCFHLFEFWEGIANSLDIQSCCAKWAMLWREKTVSDQMMISLNLFKQKIDVTAKSIGNYRQQQPQQ